MSLPRMDATLQELADAFTGLCHVIGPTGRAAVRRMLLDVADEPMYRKLLKCMNDFERVNDWRLANPEAAKQAVSES